MGRKEKRESTTRIKRCYTFWRTTSRNQKAKFPEKIAARQALGVAVRTGQIRKRPCEHCGAKKVHGHHPDYSRPLDVVWLCPPCHRKEHEAMKIRQLEEGMEVPA